MLSPMLKATGNNKSTWIKAHFSIYNLLNWILKPKPHPIPIANGLSICTQNRLLICPWSNMPTTRRRWNTSVIHAIFKEIAPANRDPWRRWGAWFLHTIISPQTANTEPFSSAFPLHPTWFFFVFWFFLPNFIYFVRILWPRKWFLNYLLKLMW